MSWFTALVLLLLLSVNTVEAQQGERVQRDFELGKSTEILAKLGIGN